MYSASQVPMDRFLDVSTMALSLTYAPALAKPSSLIFAPSCNSMHIAVTRSLLLSNVVWTLADSSQA